MDALAMSHCCLSASLLWRHIKDANIKGSLLFYSVLLFKNSSIK